MNKAQPPFEISLAPPEPVPAALSRPLGVRTDIQLHIEAVWELINELVNQVEMLQNESRFNEDQPCLNLREEVRRFEIDLIQRALNRTGGSQVQAARFLGLNATTLHEKIKRYGLQCSHLIHYARSPLSQPKTELPGQFSD